MNPLDEALARIEAAVGLLQVSVDDVLAREAAEPEAGDAPDDGAAAALAAERDRLAREVDQLRKQAAKDKKLRTEAATAVREALSGLRGAVAARGGDAPGDANE